MAKKLIPRTAINNYKNEDGSTFSDGAVVEGAAEKKDVTKEDLMEAPLPKMFSREWWALKKDYIDKNVRKGHPVSGIKPNKEWYRKGGVI